MVGISSLHFLTYSKIIVFFIFLDKDIVSSDEKMATFDTQARAENLINCAKNFANCIIFSLGKTLVNLKVQFALFEF